MKTALKIIALVAALAIAAVIAAYFAVRTPWFQDYGRAKVITGIEKSTGGRVDLHGLQLDLATLTIRLDGLTIHGTEPSGQPPLLWIRSGVARLQWSTGGMFGGVLDLKSLRVEDPEVNVIVFPDGHNNIPTPANPTAPSTSPKTILNLVSHDIDIRDGKLQLVEQQMSFSIHGQNLRAAVAYNPQARRYDGEISLDPISVNSAHRLPVRARIAIPLTLGKNGAQISNARIETPSSLAIVNARLESVSPPAITGGFSVHLSLEEMQRAFDVGVHPGKNTPQFLDAAAGIQMNGGEIQVQNSRLTLGDSFLNVDKIVVGTVEHGPADIHGRLALAELARLLRIPDDPRGVLTLAGNVTFQSADDYVITGDAESSDLSFQPGDSRVAVSHIHVPVRIDPQTIEAKGLRVAMLGGEADFDARLEHFAKLSLSGKLRGFRVQTVAAQLLGKRTGYDGTVGGTFEAHGNVKSTTPDALRAQLHLGVAPTGDGIPLRGEMNAGVRGPFAAPQVTGNVSLASLAIGGRSFDRVGADFELSPSHAEIRNGVITGKSVEARFSASANLHHWSPAPSDAIAATATIPRADLADVLALADETQVPARGVLAAELYITGTYGNPLGNAQFTVSKGVIDGQPFDQLAAAATLTDQLVTLKSAHATLGAAAIDAQGSFSHPRDSFTTGRLQLHSASNEIALKQIKALEDRRANLDGTAVLRGDIAADVRQSNGETEFSVTNASADVRANDIHDQTEHYGNITATARTSGSQPGSQLVTTIDSDFAKSRIHMTAQTQLTREYPTTWQASVENLPIQDAARLAGWDQHDQGLLSATAHASGTLRNPSGEANFRITHAVISDEAIDSMTGSAQYTHDTVTLSSLDVSAPAGRIQAHGSVTHNGFDFDNERAEMHIETAGLDLRRVENITRREPGVAGSLHATADMAVALRREPGKLEVRPSRAEFDGGISALQANNHPLGNLTVAGHTAGTALTMKVDSDLGKSAIHGNGRVNLSGDYQTDATLTFDNVTYSGFKDFFGGDTLFARDFDALAEGRVHVSGPALEPEKMTGEFTLNRAQVMTNRVARGSQNVSRSPVLQNDGPIVAKLDHSVLRIERAHITGRFTDLAASGTVALNQPRTLNLTLQGTADLKPVNDIYPDLYAGGVITLDSTVRGAPDSPNIQGKIDLKNVSLSIPDQSNGIDYANGEIVLSGHSASIQSLTAGSGGGKVTVTGSASYVNGSLQPDFKAAISHVRVRYSGASLTGSGSVQLTGTAARSAITGNISIEKVAYNSQSDVGSILAQAFGSTPKEITEPTTAEGFLGNCHLNVGIKTQSDTRYRTSLAQDLAGTAAVTLRGTLLQPGMTGRANIISGSMVFFGHTYTVNRGSVSFYRTDRIEPELDLQLQTVADSVKVTVGFSGPIDNLKMSYSSDPPLQFSDLTALLTTNATPNDATIAAHTPQAPAQTTAQMGESAVLGQAIANPAASRLQRVFGVTQFKVDPSFTNGSTLPSARVTFQQQINGAITFTYTEDLSQANSELVRVEWAINPRFSAVATRDEYGIFGVNFVYKKQFR